VAEAGVPGRFCPADYRLGPQAFGAAEQFDAELLYVVGGLYGNTVALDALLALFDAEPTARKRIVFNGDFHWFDRDPAEFARIEAVTSAHQRLRGNVETEIARAGDEAGCGCAYPDDVDDATVQRSNRILGELKRTAARSGFAAALARLPMVARARVAQCRVAITHGDERSLAGWRLAHDRIDAAWDDGLAQAMATMRADLIASSHTCAPVAASFEGASGTLAAINNGAAGMANFAGTHHGLFTRIASPEVGLPRGARALYRARIAGAEVAAVALDFDLARWLERFERQWREGSDAHLSYHRRIVGSTTLSVEQAARGRFSCEAQALAA
jgi:hypothetical protein